MTPATTRIFVVDDHPLVRELLGNLLRLQPDLEVIGQAGDPATALAAIAANPPDVAIVDISLERGSGLNLLKELRTQFPRVTIVVLSMHEEITDVERAFRAGASGYVMKRESTGQIVEAIRQVRNGRMFANPAILAQLTARLMRGPGAAAAAPAEVQRPRDGGISAARRGAVDSRYFRRPWREPENDPDVLCADQREVTARRWTGAGASRLSLARGSNPSGRLMPL
jgi:DNA-binding NarL/FixJ family response regulator